jgi:hypothetical protein
MLQNEARSTMPSARIVVEVRKPTEARTKEGAIGEGPMLGFIECLAVEEATGVTSMSS